MNQLAAVYARVSSSGQAEEDKLSLAVQTEICLKYAADNGFEVPEDCREQEVHTASQKTLARPKLDHLLTVMRRRGIRILLMDKSDRVTREGQVVAATLIHRLRDAGITLHIVAERLILDNPMSDAVFLNMAFSAQLVNLQRAERTQAVRKAAARMQGRYYKSSRPPYGYVFVPAEHGRVMLRRDRDTYEVLERIIAMRRAGKSYYRIADTLSRDHVPTPTGRASTWEPMTVRQILANPVFSGKPIAFRTKFVDAEPDEKHLLTYRKRIQLPESEWVIIPRDVFEEEPPLTPAEQKRLLAMAPVRKRTEREVHALFTGGTLRHAGCGGGIRIHQARHKGHLYSYYNCRVHAGQPTRCPGFGARTQDVDTLIWRELQKALLKPGELEKLAEAQMKADMAGDPESELTWLRRTLADLLSRKESYAEAVGRAKTTLSRDAMLANLDALAPQIDETQRRIKEHEEAIATFEARRGVLRSVYDRMARYIGFLTWLPVMPDFPYPLARALVRALGLRGEVSQDENGYLHIRITVQLHDGISQPWLSPDEEVALTDWLVEHPQARYVGLSFHPDFGDLEAEDRFMRQIGGMTRMEWLARQGVDDPVIMQARLGGREPLKTTQVKGQVEFTPLPSPSA